MITLPSPADGCNAVCGAEIYTAEFQQHGECVTLNLLQISNFAGFGGACL